MSFWMDKRHYSAFSGTDLDIRLRSRHDDDSCFDRSFNGYCVLHTAIDAYNLGYDIEVVAGATASLTHKKLAAFSGILKNVLGQQFVE